MTRLLVLLGSLVAGAVAAVAVWARKRDELDTEAYETAPERGLTPLPIEPDEAATAAEDAATAAEDAPIADKPPPPPMPSTGSNGSAGQPRMATADAVGSGAAETDARSVEAAGTADDLERIKGIGSVSRERLAEQGITTFAQIASWDDVAIDAIAGSIRVSAERIRREDWVAQARGIVEADPEAG